MNDYEARFGGIGRLFGTAGLEKIRRAHVCVVGVGGVGSWAVEALARSGVGELTLIDLDEVCLTNVNRQLPALDGSIGRAKVEVLAERVRAINPECRVHALMEFFTGDTAERLFSPRYDFVIDAIDSVPNKVRLIARCHQAGLPMIVCGGAGGRRDATAVRVLDLAVVTHDRLLQRVREGLRKDHGFPSGTKKFGVKCVCSAEPRMFPQSDGTVCERREDGTSLRLNCASGYGAATFVTGVFGFAAAGVAVDAIAEKG